MTHSADDIAQRNPNSYPIPEPFPTDRQERLLTMVQAADRLGLSQRTVWGLIKSGQIPEVRIGRAVRLDSADLDTFITRAKAAKR